MFNIEHVSSNTIVAADINQSWMTGYLSSKMSWTLYYQLSCLLHVKTIVGTPVLTLTYFDAFFVYIM